MEYGLVFVLFGLIGGVAEIFFGRNKEDRTKAKQKGKMIAESLVK
jgi:hypothetical protein